MTDTKNLTEKYPHVSAQQLRIIDLYGSLFTNTGGSEPAALLNDMQRPSTDERPNYMASTNIVRFTLAVGVQSQVALIARLEIAGALDPSVIEAMGRE